jgi:hypothetical protein
MHTWCVTESMHTGALQKSMHMHTWCVTESMHTGAIKRACTRTHAYARTHCARDGLGQLISVASNAPSLVFMIDAFELQLLRPFVLHLSSCVRVGQNHIYKVSIWYSWQVLHQIYCHIRRIYTVLANPICVLFHVSSCVSCLQCQVRELRSLCIPAV